MSRFQHIIFVCQKERAPGSPKGCCTSKGSPALLDRLKELTHAHKLKGQVKVTEAGCLDYCKKGITAVVYTQTNAGTCTETWYTHLEASDADALFETHVLNNATLEQKVEAQPLRAPLD